MLPSVTIFSRPHLHPCPFSISPTYKLSLRNFNRATFCAFHQSHRPIVPSVLVHISSAWINTPLHLVRLLRKSPPAGKLSSTSNTENGASSSPTQCSFTILPFRDLILMLTFPIQVLRQSAYEKVAMGPAQLTGASTLIRRRSHRPTTRLRWIRQPCSISRLRHEEAIRLEQPVRCRRDRRRRRSASGTPPSRRGRESTSGRRAQPKTGHAELGRKQRLLRPGSAAAWTWTWSRANARPGRRSTGHPRRVSRRALGSAGG